MAWRAALAAGYSSADLFLDSMTYQEWIELQAVDCIEPIGMRGIEIILARIGELLSAFCGGEMRAHDFAPWLKQPEPKPMTTAQSREALEAHLKTLVGVR